MDGVRILKNSQIIILGLCIAAATIISSVILSQGILQAMRLIHQTINVTGSAQEIIRSDYIVWKCSFSRRAKDLPIAYRGLKEDSKQVLKYLYSQGISKDEIIINPFSTIKIFKKDENGNDTATIEAYELEEDFEVRSIDVAKIDVISRRSTELINQGILFESSAPNYFYTKLNELKVKMLADATENAKLRAESMANSTGNKIGPMRSAKMGVFQITPVASSDVSDYGENDTDSLDKKVMAVVSVSFVLQ